MPKKLAPFPKPATGWVGFVFAFALSVFGLFVLFQPTSPVGVGAVVIGATVLGLLTARFGEPVFEKVLGFFRWLH
jgi:hypothetical protein